MSRDNGSRRPVQPATSAHDEPAVGELRTDARNALGRGARMWGSGGRDSARSQGRRRHRGGRGEEPMVPDAQFESYYGRQILKSPVWTEDIPAYFFLGGLAGGSSLLAAGADLTDNSRLRTAGRLTSLAALLGSTYALIHDLGRPRRFHHMLRVAKPTSPMSVGTWILAAYGPAAGLAAVSEAAPLLPRPLRESWVGRLLPGVGGVAGGVGAVLAAPLASYTAVLLADTAVPSWHEGYRELPFVFVGSAAAAAGGMGMLAVPGADAGPARRLALFGAALDLAASRRMEGGMGLAAEPLHTGRAGILLRAAQVLTAAGAVLGAALGRRSRAAAVASGAALLAGSACTRFGVFEAGVESTKDPKYVVVPQRQRLDEGRPVRADAGR